MKKGKGQIRERERTRAKPNNKHIGLRAGFYELGGRSLLIGRVRPLMKATLCELPELYFAMPKVMRI
jgi:hypothetical protein